MTAPGAVGRIGVTETRATQTGTEPEEPAATPVTAGAQPHVAFALSVQRTAGNAALVRLLARRAVIARQPVEVASVLQDIWDEEHAGATEAQNDAVKLLSVKPAESAWTELKWSLVSRTAAQRVYHPERINQADLGVCGPAAALHALSERDPRAYARLVIQIFETGTAAGKKVNKTLRSNTPMKGQAHADWMVLSAMQDVTNDVLEYHGRPDSGDFFSLSREGAPDTGVKYLLEKFSGCVATTTYSCNWWGVKDQTEKVNKLLADHGSDVVVVMFVASKIMTDENAKGDQDHFIRLLKPVRWGADSVEADVFTWGGTRTLKMKPKNFERMTYEYIVGATKKGIL